MSDPSGDNARSLAADLLAEEAWFNRLPPAARDDLGDRNHAQAMRERGVALARAVRDVPLTSTFEPTDPYGVTCPKCGERPGLRCTNQAVIVRDVRLITPHRERVHAMWDALSPGSGS